jgi:hypothetical protein
VDLFAIGLLVVVALAVLGACLVARANSGMPLSEFGQRGTARASMSADSLDAEDLRQMLAATNALRRARGLPERTLADAISEFDAG